MIKKHSFDGSVWLELVVPSREDIKDIMHEHDIDPVVAHELISPSPKSHIDFGDDFIYMVIHFPVFKHSHRNQGEYRQEIDFLITKNFLLTATYDSVDALNQFSKDIEVDSILKKNLEEHSQDFLFYTMLSKIYHSINEELFYIEDQLFEIEKRIFDGEEREMVIALSKVSRQVLEFKKLIDLHRPLLEVLKEKGARSFGNNFDQCIKDLMANFYHVRQTIQSFSEVVYELRETNNSLLTTRQNEAIIILTIMAFVTFPLTVIAGIFGMNTKYMPIVGTPYDFWIIIGIMFGVTALFFSYFKYKKWF